MENERDKEVTNDEDIINVRFCTGAYMRYRAVYTVFR